MPEITQDMVVNDLIRWHPETTGVFNVHRIDSCCGGARTLAQAAAQDGASLEALLADLNAAVERAAEKV